jgi:precorrin-4 C11-methyltransferase
MNKMVSILVYSEKALMLAEKIKSKGFNAEILYAPHDLHFIFYNRKALVFIGSLGICVRQIAPFMQDKRTDPAVVNIDAKGQFVQSVISGHLGGANQLAGELSQILGAIPVITTVSDTSGLWPLDLLPDRYQWNLEYAGELVKITADFVNGKKTALLLDIRDNGTLFLETNLPEHVDVFYNVDNMQVSEYDLIIAITPFLYNFNKPALFYRPRVLHLGLGSQKGLDFTAFEKELSQFLNVNFISVLSVKQLNTVDLKSEEPAFLMLSQKWNVPLACYSGEILARYNVPNPSKMVIEVTGISSVCEAAAMHGAQNKLLVEKNKIKAGEYYVTVAAAIDHDSERAGLVEFVGAGPGDPDLISVKGKKMLQTADYILYAGSLVPKELTLFARSGCVVESSASMDLTTQLERMKFYYIRGLFIVRLHTGDPCIYGAIQEQMAIMDEWGWNYHITPGISSFQAAAAALRSQFTIPGEVQTIILTRGEGRIPMPEREHLHKLAQSQSTMCIYLSASIAPKIQEELLVHYPADTPVAICFKLTWKDERIFRCTLNGLAQTVLDNALTMTTLIVVGKAIDNRQGVSKLYHSGFEHAFRKEQKS